MTTKRCSICKKNKDVSEFYIRWLLSNSATYTSACKECSRTRNRTSYKTKIRGSQNRDGHLRRVYGLSTEEYGKLYAKQGGVCAICGKPETSTNKKTGEIYNLSVDHNHQTGAIRGLLCYSCNVSLGHFKDDISKLFAAIEYLKKYS